MIPLADRDLEKLSPEMRVKAYLFCQKCLLRGVDVLIYETWRSQDRQDALWAQGRTVPGRKVTWTKTSKHGRVDPVTKAPASDAFDAVPRIKGVPDWSARKEYLIMGDVAKELGLRWGGNWDGDDKPGEPGENDSPHFELVR